MALKLTLILCVVAIWAVDYAQCASPKQAPAPAVDCSSLILNMADCLSFVQNGSTVTKPEGTCCAGLKSVLKADAGCLCEAFKSSAQLGVVLNVTKASTLPTACKVSAPSISNCELSTSPAGAPGLSPESAPTTAAAPELGAPEQGAGANEQAPAPAPGSSGSSMLSATVGSLLIALVIASSSWF